MNPFTLPHYTELLVLEDRLDGASVKRLDAETPGGIWSQLEAAQARNPGHGLHAATVWKLFSHRDAEGRTVAERWERAGFPGLKNDERVFFRAKMRTRVVLLEVHRVLDAERFEAVDLLAPEAPAMLLVDRRMTARAVRFSTFLTWAYPLPHFWRMSGTGIVVPEMGSFTPLEIVQECIAHLGGPAAPGEARERWLVEHFARIDDVVNAVAHERRRRLLEGVDAQWGNATYAPQVPLAACHAALGLDPAVDRDELSAEECAEGFQVALVCFDDRASTVGAQAGIPGRPTLGRILLAEKLLRVEAMGAARLAALRARIEARLGERLRLVSERRDDHGSRLAAQEPAADPKLVPSRLLEQPESLSLLSTRVAPPPPGVSREEYQAALREEQRHQWVDLACPALDGRTPREAADNPNLRPRLVELVKRQIRHADEENLRSRGKGDAGVLAGELGLREIDFPPPPARAEPEPDDEQDEMGGGTADFEWPHPAADRPPAPRLSGPPLAAEEALDRIEVAMESLANAASGLAEIDASGSTVIDDLAEAAGDWLSEEEFSFAVPFLLQAWFALVPHGVRAPALRREAMAAALAHARGQLHGRRGEEEVFDLLIAECRQPDLMKALVLGIAGLAESVSKKQRPSPRGMVGAMVLGRVLIDELDRALRVG